MRITPHKKQRGYPAKKRKTYTHITRETTPQSTTTTAVEVVVDDAEYTTDIIGLLDLQSQGQARSCADKIRLDHPTWPSGQIYHAIWVLAHQVANGYIVRTSWARTVEKMIINGIEHRADIPSPAQVRLERMSKERLIWGKKAAQHREKSEIARTEAVFRTLPEPEKEEYRERFRRKLGLVGTTTAIEIGAIGEYISSLQGGR